MRVLSGDYKPLIGIALVESYVCILKLRARRGAERRRAREREIEAAASAARSMSIMIVFYEIIRATNDNYRGRLIHTYICADAPRGEDNKRFRSIVV